MKKGRRGQLEDSEKVGNLPFKCVVGGDRLKENASQKRLEQPGELEVARRSEKTRTNQKGVNRQLS